MTMRWLQLTTSKIKRHTVLPSWLLRMPPPEPRSKMRAMPGPASLMQHCEVPLLIILLATLLITPPTPEQLKLKLHRVLTTWQHTADTSKQPLVLFNVISTDNN
jgi:hypothetical protein